MTARELYEQHLAEAADGTPLRAAFDRVIDGTASIADLIAFASWELCEAAASLPPDPHDEPRARPVDGYHASACVVRAASALHQLRKLTEKT